MKTTAPILNAWRQILDAVPSSTLTIIGNPDGGNDLAGANKPVYGRFARHGIGRDRVNVLPRQIRPKYLASIERDDIALDPFPYAGETTTFDALWMGVPVVTLAGRSYASRAGVNPLTNVGLPELIATSIEDYVRIATALAGNLDQLSGIRRTLRDRMKASPLAEGGSRVCRTMEAAFGSMWREQETAHVISGQGRNPDASRSDGIAETAPSPALPQRTGGGGGSLVPSTPAKTIRPRDEFAPDLSAALPPGVDERMKEIGGRRGEGAGMADARGGAGALPPGPTSRARRGGG